jgi:hypothetical protein
MELTIEQALQQGVAAHKDGKLQERLSIKSEQEKGLRTRPLQ